MHRATRVLLIGSLLSSLAVAQDLPFSSPVPDTGDTIERLLSDTTRATGDELLDPAEAFIASVTLTDDDTLLARWDIADGYYLYQERFRFAIDDPAVALGEPRFPSGEWQEDKFFGEVETYRDDVTISIPLNWQDGRSRPVMLELQTISQGCADVGVCYPPQQETIPVILSRRPGQPDATLR